jgi:hypothetical protein
VATTLLLSADPNVKLESGASLTVKGSATINGAAIAHQANPEDKLKLIAIGPPPDIITAADTKVVEIEAGGKAQVAVHIDRRNGYGGRVPVEVRNLPPRVFVTDVGLNGVLINEDESRRTFTIRALPNAEPVEQLIYVSGQIETRSNQQNSYAAPTAILLKVKPAKTAMAQSR